jgi:hypothetical protein
MAIGGVISTGNHPKALWPGIHAWWGNTYSEHPPEWKALVHEVTSSSQSYEELVGDTGFGLAPVKAQGQGIQYDANVQSFTARATHVTYALGYAVTMEELDDNLYEKVSKIRARANAFSQRQTRENVVANVLNNGFSSTAQKVADGQAFFSTAHPTVTGSTYSNKPTTDADLSEASLEDALISIAGFTNDRGLLISVVPKKLIVARQNVYNAARIMKSVYTPSSADNAINAIKAMGALPGGVVVNHYLTAANAWFLQNEIPTGSGVVFFERKPVAFDQDNDFSTKNALAASVTRFSVVVGDPRCYYGVNGP